jgi:hypothetical protein
MMCNPQRHVMNSMNGVTTSINHNHGPVLNINDHVTMLNNSMASSNNHVTNSTNHGSNSGDQVTSVDEHVTHSTNQGAYSENRVPGFMSHVASSSDHVTNSTVHVTRSNRRISEEGSTSWVSGAHTSDAVGAVGEVMEGTVAGEREQQDQFSSPHHHVVSTGSEHIPPHPLESNEQRIVAVIATIQWLSGE